MAAEVSLHDIIEEHIAEGTTPTSDELSRPGVMEPWEATRYSYTEVDLDTQAPPGFYVDRFTRGGIERGMLVPRYHEVDGGIYDRDRHRVIAHDDFAQLGLPYLRAWRRVIS